MIELLKAVAVVAAVVTLNFLLALLVGLGRCMDCSRLCRPWNAYCHRHRPITGERP
jgi:hypothetical protein